MATIPPSDTDKKEDGDDDDIENMIIEDPESEEELKSMLGL